MIYLDMDGVLSNFNDAANKKLLAANLPEITDDYWYQRPEKTDDLFWRTVDTSLEFWAKLKAFPKGLCLYSMLFYHRPHILSAYSTKAPGCIEGKKLWLKNVLGLEDESRIHIVRRSEKQQFANSDSILIDDYENNCQEFIKAGGKAIQFNQNINIVELLQKIKNFRSLSGEFSNEYMDERDTTKICA